MANIGIIQSIPNPNRTRIFRIGDTNEEREWLPTFRYGLDPQDRRSFRGINFVSTLVELTNPYLTFNTVFTDCQHLFPSVPNGLEVVGVTYRTSTIYPIKQKNSISDYRATCEVVVEDKRFIADGRIGKVASSGGVETEFIYITTNLNSGTALRGDYLITTYLPVTLYELTSNESENARQDSREEIEFINFRSSSAPLQLSNGKMIIRKVHPEPGQAELPQGPLLKTQIEIPDNFLLAYGADFDMMYQGINGESAMLANTCRFSLMEGDFNGITVPLDVECLERHLDKEKIAPNPNGDSLLMGIVSGNFVQTPGQRTAYEIITESVTLDIHARNIIYVAPTADIVIKLPESDDPNYEGRLFTFKRIDRGKFSNGLPRVTIQGDRSALIDGRRSLCLKLERVECVCKKHDRYYPGPAIRLQYVRGEYYRL
jgi:hypothetical protein